MSKMTTTQLIARLQELVARHGDLPVVLSDADTDWLMAPHCDVWPSPETAHWNAIEKHAPKGWKGVVLWGDYNEARPTSAAG